MVTATTITKPWIKASRNEVEIGQRPRRAIASAFAKNIADAAHRMDQRAIEAAIDLLPKPAHHHIDHAGLRIELIVPHRFDQHPAGDDLVAMANQVLEQPELARLQRDGP